MQRFKKFSPSTVDVLSKGRHADPVVAGLSLIVNEAGKKSWSFRRRIAGSGVIVTLKLGCFPAYSIRAARAWATDLNDTVERGDDPRVAIRIEKAQALTLEHAHHLYIEAMRRGDRKVLKLRILYDKAKSSKVRAKWRAN